MIKNDLKVQITLSTIFLSLIVIAEIWCAYGFYNMYKNNKKEYTILVSECKKSEMRARNLNCSTFVSKIEPIMPDTVSFFFIVIIIQVLAPIIIMIISSYTIYRKYKTNFYKNYLMRINYKEYLKQSYHNVLKSIWLFPVSLLILFIVCFFMSGHFNINKTLTYWSEESIPLSIKYIKNFVPFIIIYVFNIVVNSWFYVNLALITIKKSSNFIVSTLLSYILFLFCDIVLEVIIGTVVFANILKTKQTFNIFNLFNYWKYDGITTVESLIIFTLFNILLALLSFKILGKIYKDKENVIIASETI